MATKESTKEASTKEASKHKIYVVTSSAVVLRTGVKKNQVSRFLRGARLQLDSSDDRTQTLLSSKSIALEVEGKAARASTIRTVARALGGMHDPVKAPKQDILPVTATNDEIESVK